MLTAYFIAFTLTTLAALTNSKARRLVCVILVSWAVSFLCERVGLQTMAPHIDALTFYAMLLATLRAPCRECIVATRIMAFLLFVHAAFTALLAIGAQAHFAYMWSINGIYLCVMLTLVGDLKNARQRAGSVLDGLGRLVSGRSGVFATPKGRYREIEAGRLEPGVSETHRYVCVPASVEAR